MVTAFTIILFMGLFSHIEAISIGLLALNHISLFLHFRFTYLLLQGLNISCHLNFLSFHVFENDLPVLFGLEPGVFNFGHSLLLFLLRHCFLYFFLLLDFLDKDFLFFNFDVHSHFLLLPFHFFHLQPQVLLFLSASFEVGYLLPFVVSSLVVEVLLVLFGHLPSLLFPPSVVK